MKLRSALIPAVGLGLALAFAFAPASHAQTAPSAAAIPSNIKIAILNPSKVIEDLKETKDGIERLKADQAQFEQKRAADAQKIKELQTSLQITKPGTPEYSAKQREFTTAAISFDAWSKVTEADLKRSQASLYRSLFDKLQIAVAKLAAQRGIGLVIADQRLPIPDNIDPTIELISNTVTRRTLLYANPALDISSDVTATMDAEYLKR